MKIEPCYNLAKDMSRAISTNLAPLLEKRLTPKYLTLLRQVAEVAHRASLPLFLVGGSVRDLLLARPATDLDLVVEGEASSLASLVVKGPEGRVVARSQFGTVKLKIKGLTVDLAATRRETYSRPGALPTVSSGSIRDDMSRRDFSINAMAIELSPSTWGDLSDPKGGRKDVEAGVIRVLHSKSFEDDATRILRALRYELRLGFQMEEETQSLLKTSLKYLNAIGGDRIRHELEHIFQEDRASEVLARAQELGVLSAIHPTLGKVSCLSLHGIEGQEKDDLLYLALLAYPLSVEELPTFAARLNMPTRWTKVARDTAEVRELSPELGKAHIRPSQVYDRLKDRSVEALKVCTLLAKEPEFREQLELFMSKLRYVKPSLDGEELLNLGVPRGPIVGKLLAELRRARLDGEVGSRQQEEGLVMKHLAKLHGEV